VKILGELGDFAVEFLFKFFRLRWMIGRGGGRSTTTATRTVNEAKGFGGVVGGEG